MLESWRGKQDLTDMIDQINFLIILNGALFEIRPCGFDLESIAHCQMWSIVQQESNSKSPPQPQNINVAITVYKLWNIKKSTEL